MKNSQQGYKFEREVGEGLNRLGGYNFKIPDTRMLRIKTVKVPADFIWCGEKDLIFLEAKTTIMNRFPLRNIKEHQLELGLQIDEKTVAKYFFIIYLRRHKKVFLISPQKIKMLTDEYLSIPLNMFEKYGIEVKRYTARYNKERKQAFIDLESLTHINSFRF